MADRTNNMNYAMIMAESGAEAFKAAGDDAGRLARLLGGTHSGNNDTDIVRVYYCSNWQHTTRDNAAKIMTLNIRGGDYGLLYCDIDVVKLEDDEDVTIFEITAVKGVRNH
jgi:hypothetical protein